MSFRTLAPGLIWLSLIRIRKINFYAIIEVWAHGIFFWGGRPFAWTALVARADPSGINKEVIMGTEIGDIMSRAEGCLQDDQKQ
jgi:hypothetical protein